MIKKHAAFILALSLTTMTACGRLTETDADNTSSAETIYVMTTAMTSLAMTATETAASSEIETLPTTSEAATTASVPVSTTVQNETSPVTSVIETTVKPTVTVMLPAATTQIHPETKTESKHTTVHHVTTENAYATQRPRTTAHQRTTETTTTTVAAEHETETAATTVSGETKMIGGVVVADYGTDHPRAIEAFSNNNKVSSRYAQTLDQFKEQVGENVNVWCMVVPTSQAFYTPEDIAGKLGDQQEEYRNIADHMENVTGVPVYETLRSHQDEAIYSRTDYHWQPLAAYYAGEQFAAFAGVPYAPLDTYDAVTRQGYVGAFSKVNKITLLEEYPEEFTYYKPANLDQVKCTYYSTAFTNARQGSLFHEDNSIAASYTVFVGTDECILETETNVDNNRVLVIFKDSYGNALVPFLTQSFSKIYLCDFRYFDGNAIEFLDEVGATDVLFAMSTVAVTTSGKVDQVAALMN